jgi:hypothetical protein
MRGLGTTQHHITKKDAPKYLSPTGLRKSYRGMYKGFKVYGVGGGYVRDNLDVSFTMGAHHFVPEDKFIPANEVWVDDELSPFDFEGLKIHEATEAQRMRDLKEPYEVAHYWSNVAETKWREKFKKKYKAQKFLTPKEALEIGHMLGIDFNKEKFTPKTLAEGMNVEVEHGIRDPKTDVTHNDPIATAKIAWAHLREKKDYYELLKKVEG